MSYHESILRQIDEQENRLYKQEELHRMREEVKGFDGFFPSINHEEFTQGRLFIRIDRVFTADHIDSIKSEGSDFISSVRQIFDTIILISFKKEVRRHRVYELVQNAFLPF